MALSVYLALSLQFLKAQNIYPGYSRTQYAPTGAVAVTQIADPVAAEAQATVSPTLRIDYDFKNLEPSDRSTTSKFAIVGGLHIHSGTSCDDAGGHLFDDDLVTFDPWTTMYGPTDATGGARGSFVIRSGHSAKQVVGRVVVLHDST